MCLTTAAKEQVLRKGHRIVRERRAEGSHHQRTVAENKPPLAKARTSNATTSATIKGSPAKILSPCDAYSTAASSGMTNGVSGSEHVFHLIARNTRYACPKWHICDKQKGKTHSRTTKRRHKMTKLLHIFTWRNVRLSCLRPQSASSPEVCVHTKLVHRLLCGPSTGTAR